MPQTMRNETMLKANKLVPHGPKKKPQGQQMGPEKKQKVTGGQAVIPGGCQRIAREAKMVSMGAHRGTK